MTEQQVLSSSAPLIVGLVAASERTASTPNRARYFYTGTLFRFAASYVRHRCGAWYILSTRYGLVHPDDVLQPPDPPFRFTKRHDRQAWAERVWERAGELGLDRPDTHWIVMAGAAHQQHLVPLLQGTLEFPLAGRGMVPQQLAWLSQVRRMDEDEDEEAVGAG